MIGTDEEEDELDDKQQADDDDMSEGADRIVAYTEMVRVLTRKPVLDHLDKWRDTVRDMHASHIAAMQARAIPEIDALQKRADLQEAEGKRRAVAEEAEGKRRQNRVYIHYGAAFALAAVILIATHFGLLEQTTAGVLVATVVGSLYQGGK